MLKEKFVEVYTKFKLHLYQEMLGNFENREATLTTIETFCMEAILALKDPTVNEFASFLGISPPNAAYKVNNLIKKGYVIKVQDTSDKRIFHLRPTEKYMAYYNISASYMNLVMERIAQRFPTEDCAKLEEMLTVISSELMDEVQLPQN